MAYSKITAAPFLLGYAVFYVLTAIVALGDNFGLLLFLLLVAAGLISFLHYECWKRIPPQFHQMEPKKAVGLMLIPIFNAVWAFYALPALAESVRRWQQFKRGDDPAIKELKLVAYITATVAVVTAVVSLTDFLPLYWLCGAADLACCIYFFREVVDAENRLLSS